MHKSNLYSLFILYSYTLFIYFYSYFDKVNTLDTNTVELKCLVHTILVKKNVWYKLGHRNIIATLRISLFERVKFDRIKETERQNFKNL